ncbi:MAG: hypothetical protein AAGG57_15120 [Pseudomonadota bacterium]
MDDLQGVVLMRTDRERPGRDRSPILASAQAQSFVDDGPGMGRFFLILERGWTLAVARSEGRITDSTLVDQRRKGRARRREIREKRASTMPLAALQRRH